eukprot:1307856-Rhodomonas_salina.3
MCGADVAYGTRADRDFSGADDAESQGQGRGRVCRLVNVGQISQRFLNVLHVTCPTGIVCDASHMRKLTQACFMSLDGT